MHARSWTARTSWLASAARADELLGRACAPGSVVVGFLNPLGDPGYVQRLADANVTALAMEMIPRITRAQSMDALSSQSNIAGYKAVLLAAAALPKFFPMLTTAAGTIRAGESSRARRGRRRAAGDRDRPPARRGRQRIRRARRRQGASAIARREFPRVRPRRRRRGRRADTPKSSRPNSRSVSALGWSSRSARTTS